ncbi:hypothetical protein QFC21_001537 [Naganishia friedmannii]|uniref:Uncharacterized protein n=1 Tax=Naganishia friedmannii TaxID=89922 RepID=A0ACC2W6A1_9TREE|nr:hypothetical protein QFC21_001537 [Naganishia friedmannii]
MQRQSQTNADYKDSEANIVLRSSDGVEFRLHDFDLNAASPILREKIESGEVQIAIDVKAPIVRFLLDIVTHKRPPRLDNTIMKALNFTEANVNDSFHDLFSGSSSDQSKDRRMRAYFCLDDIANTWKIHSVTLFIRQGITPFARSNPVDVFEFALLCRPIDEGLVSASLRHFSDASINKCDPQFWQNIALKARNNSRKNMLIRDTEVLDYQIELETAFFRAIRKGQVGIGKERGDRSRDWDAVAVSFSLSMKALRLPAQLEQTTDTEDSPTPSPIRSALRRDY